MHVDTVTRINAFWNPESSASAKPWRVVAVMDAQERFNSAAGDRPLLRRPRILNDLAFEGLEARLGDVIEGLCGG